MLISHFLCKQICFDRYRSYCTCRHAFNNFVSGSEISYLCRSRFAALAKFILSDIRNRSELAFQWLYEEFNIFLENSRGPNDRAAQENYDACLTSLLQGLLEKHDSREGSAVFAFVIFSTDELFVRTFLCELSALCRA